ncbi:MAG: hypothetical protein HY671_11120 [Chloroflexi bacterium]|nr:hypothetical protein [Chloroflexota bacterium]
MVIVSRCIEDEQINVVAMTEGVPSNMGPFHQAILCKRRDKVPRETLFCILVLKTESRSLFRRSSKGETNQREISDRYGLSLAKFRNAYLAQVAKVFDLPENSRALWREICPEHFPLWEPIEGPYAHIQEHESSIVLLRVYETAQTVDKFVKDGRQPRVVDPGQADIAIVRPVIDDMEFRRRQSVLEDILKRHGC